MLQITLISKALAEMAGTFAVIFVGSASLLLAERHPQGVSSQWIALVWGAAVCLAILAVGHVSGAHLNPAVSLTFAALKRMPFSHLVFYWAGQFAGGLSAVIALKLITERL